MLSVEEISELLKQIPSGFKDRHDPFFSQGNELILNKFKKLGALSNAEDFDDGETELEGASHRLNAPTDKEIFCNVFGCQNIFQDIASYESHYKSVHSYICSICRRSFPTGHLLDLHLSEKHDAYFAARVERGDQVFCCILEECKIHFKNPEERKDHCIKDHKMPANYRYFPDTKVKAETKNTKKESKAIKSNVLHQNDEEEMEVLEDNKNELTEAASSATKKVKPFKFSFGHQVSKTFQAKGSGNKDTFADMNDLKAALEDAME